MHEGEIVEQHLLNYTSNSIFIYFFDVCYSVNLYGESTRYLGVFYHKCALLDCSSNLSNSNSLFASINQKLTNLLNLYSKKLLTIFNKVIEF